MNDLRWYIMRGGTNTKNFLKTITLLIAPVVPHIAEEAWERLGGEGFVSFAQWPKPDKELDIAAEMQESLVGAVVADIENIIKFKGIRAKECHLFVSEPWKHKVHKIIFAKKERNPNAIIAELMKDAEMKKHGKEVPRLVNRLIKAEGEIMVPKKEFEVLSGAIPFLERHFGMKFAVEMAEKAKIDKAGAAVPGKPSIYLE